MKKSECKRKWKKWRKGYRKAIQRLTEDNADLWNENARLNDLLDKEYAEHLVCRKALEEDNSELWKKNTRLKSLLDQEKASHMSCKKALEEVTEQFNSRGSKP